MTFTIDGNHQFFLAVGIEVMNKCIIFLVLVNLLLPTNAMAQSAASDNAISSNASALLTRQQQRMDILEQGLKEIRGVIEQDLREIKLKVEQLGSSSAQAGTAQVADLNALRNEMEKLNDTLAMTSRRMERTLEITSDTEFRLLRLEKRVQTLISLGGSELASAAAQQETIAADAPSNVQMTRESNSGVTKWSVEEGALNRELETLDSANTPAAAAAKDVVETDNNSPFPADNTVSGDASTLKADVAVNDAPAVPAAPAEPEVLPAVSPEEQYRFALGRALQNDLETAELAFAEFRVFNKDHERQADATFWLGRVQFMRGDYEKAAMTFSEFNSTYPRDARLVDTTMWIAESVSHFAPAEQACEIYASLPKLLDTPPQIFMTQLAALSNAAKCKS
jgi:TolA-binding protein